METLLLAALALAVLGFGAVLTVFAVSGLYTVANALRAPAIGKPAGPVGRA
ncbi:hypothetical protein [Azospirillum soli]|uniref:hypothetical protein n=1 Tax=Azospirillum soli TaxID=1304799 RepID=UPI001AE730D1|nr:hypothetical protein [Azospirillum soli]MBP2315598.1 hypothetical protein [Azospirillum soli]